MYPSNIMQMIINKLFLICPAVYYRRVILGTTVILMTIIMTLIEIIWHIFHTEFYGIHQKSEKKRTKIRRHETISDVTVQ